MVRTVLFYCLAFLLSPTLTSARSISTPASVVHALLSVPDTRLSYERSKLAIDRVVVPDADEQSITAQIDQLAAEATRIAAGGNDIAKLQAVRQVIYQAGAWNRNNPFSYDLNDPYGALIANKLLSTYLKTHRGNCVSMPVLQLIVAERLGLNVSLSTAPQHVFVRYTNPTNGRSIAIEATSGGYPAREEWYRGKMAITDRQVESGIYLGHLSKRESIALMASTIMEWLMGEGRYQEAIDVSDLIPENFPKDVHALVARASAHGHLIESEFTVKYPTPKAIPPALQSRYRMLVAANVEGFSRAETLGWVPTE